MQVSQSGWQWGNPTPQGNTIRAMDFIAGRGYAIGDDGTALRTDDGGATWTGLATGTSQDLTRVQAVTPRRRVILGGDGCVVRRSDDGGRTFRKIYVLAEIDCPEPVAAAYFVDPQTGYLLLRNGNVLRTTDGGETFGRGTAIPGTPGSAGGGQRRPGRRDLHHPRRRPRVPRRHEHRLPHDRRRRVVDAGAGRRDRQRPARARGRRASTFYAFGPNTLLRTTDGGQTWQRRGAGAGNTITGIGCATDRPVPAHHRPRRPAAAHARTAAAPPRRSRRRTAAAVRGRASRSPTRAVAAGAGGATVVSDDGGRNYAPVGGDIAGSFQFGLRLGPAPEHRVRARRPRPARAHDRQRRARGGRSTSPPRPTCRTRRSPPPTRATRSTSAAACSARQRRPELVADRPRHDHARRAR